MFSLDTNAVIDVMRRPRGRMRDRILKAQGDGTIVLSSIVLFELSFGIHRGDSPNGRQQVDGFLAGVAEVLDFDGQDAEAAGEVRHELQSQGLGIGPFDTLIAGQARRRGLIVVTSNVREFGRVRGLTIENWRA